MKYIMSLLLLSLFSFNTIAQDLKEADSPVIPKKPLDGFYKKENIKNRRVLAYDHVREADVFWEKRIWRIIDVREKINKPFVSPQAPFIKILMDAAARGSITVYSPMDDEFKNPYTSTEAANLGSSIDTVWTMDPVTFIESPVIVRNDFNWDQVKRFRVKEVWYMDEETSTMKVRILGIAPMKEVYDDNDNFRYEQPLFWAYYPEVRNVLATEEVINPKNDANPMSWEDIFEMRYFSSYVYKQSNVYDYRVQDYKSGLDNILEAKKISDSLFQFEHDLWSN